MNAARASARRLKHRDEYRQVLNHGQCYLGAFFCIHYAPNQSSYSRFGLRVAKKMVAKASQRNRIKRQIREFFRKNAFESTDYVVRVRRGAAQQSNEILRQDLANCLN